MQPFHGLAICATSVTHDPRAFLSVYFFSSNDTHIININKSIMPAISLSLIRVSMSVISFTQNLNKLYFNIFC